MQIWVDADACPGAIREILFRAAQKRAVTVTLVANQAIRLPPSPHLKMVCVPAGFDMADQRIAEAMQPGDLVVICQSGAYGASASPQRFLSHPAVAEVLV